MLFGDVFWMPPVNSIYIYIYIWNDNIQSFNCENNEASIPVFHADWTSVSRSLKRQVYADWTSVSFPLCKPLNGQYKFERNHEKKIKNIANSMQYIVGANCFAHKIYCIEFAVRKKVVKYIVSFLDAQGNNTERDILARKFHFTGR